MEIVNLILFIFIMFAASAVLIIGFWKHKIRFAARIGLLFVVFGAMGEIRLLIAMIGDQTTGTALIALETAEFIRTAIAIGLALLMWATFQWQFEEKVKGHFHNEKQTE